MKNSTSFTAGSGELSIGKQPFKRRFYLRTIKLQICHSSYPNFWHWSFQSFLFPNSSVHAKCCAIARLKTISQITKPFSTFYYLHNQSLPTTLVPLQLQYIYLNQLWRRVTLYYQHPHHHHNLYSKNYFMQMTMYLEIWIGPVLHVSNNRSWLDNITWSPAWHSLGTRWVIQLANSPPLFNHSSTLQIPSQGLRLRQSRVWNSNTI